MKQYLILDYETRSEADLRKVGAFEYAIHPSTRLLCAAWRLGTRETLEDAKTIGWNTKLFPDSERRIILHDHLANPKIEVVAHNALFEQVITRHVLPRHLEHGPVNVPIEHWSCTAASAAAHALPRHLEGACDSLSLFNRKNPRGKLLIQRHCKPRKPSKDNPAIWNNDRQGLKDLLKYCMDDVDAQTELFLRLPPLIPFERKVWALNQRLNTDGVYVDRQLVKQALILTAQESKTLTAEAIKLCGIGPTKRAQLLKYLEKIGCVLPNMQGKTVQDAIKTGLATGKAKRLLEIRQAVCKTSTAKYKAFELRSRFDSRLRDLQLYHGASTGRESGMGVQPHNFPRGTLGDLTDDAIEAILTGDLEWLRALTGSPMDALSSCLRGVITASPGHELFSGDFNAIEARVVFWLAGHTEGLKLFTGKNDPYRVMAAVVYGVPVEKVTDAQREVGKRVILGCGFGMGWKKFWLTCEQFNTPISLKLAAKAVNAYRYEHEPVKILWGNLERAAIAATRERGKRFTVNRTTWFVKDNFLYCRLPSGRHLAFYGPKIKYETKWDRKRPVLYHWSVNPKTKKWELAGTYGGKICENVTQAVARDCMVAAHIRTAEAKYKPRMSVHDELVNERKKGYGTLEEFESLMATVPDWADGLPLKVKAWKGKRYRK